VIGEFERAPRLRLGQERALARYLRNSVAPFSNFHRETLRNTTVGGRSDLAALPLTSLDDIGDPSELVLRPSSTNLALSADRELRARWAWARVRHRTGAFNRTVLEPRFKPVHWHQEVIPVGYSSEDLDHLAEIGREALEMAGVGPNDVLLSIYPPGPNLPTTQLQLGARRAGISALFAAPDLASDEAARMRPTVLAGRAADLVRLLDEGREAGFSFAGLSTLLVLGEPLDPAQRARLADVGGSKSGPVAVVAAWAPPGVRSLWSECRNGNDVHSWPSSEVVDPLSGNAVPPGADGEVVWTPLGWNGTVILRLRTGVYGCIDDTPCVACGRTSPRLRLVPDLPPFARILDDHPAVELWQAELRTFDGAEELVVFLTAQIAGHPGRLLRELDRQLSVTQFVVLDRRTLSNRLREHGDVRVLDLRS
jgi:hypothetical protein